MSVAEVKQTADQKMHKSIESLKTNLSKIRTGRPSPAILDRGYRVWCATNPSSLNRHII